MEREGFLEASVSRSARMICAPQVVDLYWGVDPEEWDSPELQRLRMKLLEECLKTSAGPCFVVSTKRPLVLPGSLASPRSVTHPEFIES